MTDDTAASLRAKVAALEAEHQGSEERHLLDLIDQWTERGTLIIKDLARLMHVTPMHVLAEVTMDEEVASTLLSQL